MDVVRPTSYHVKSAAGVVFCVSRDRRAVSVCAFVLRLCCVRVVPIAYGSPASCVLSVMCAVRALCHVMSGMRYSRDSGVHKQEIKIGLRFSCLCDAMRVGCLSP